MIPHFVTAPYHPDCSWFQKRYQRFAGNVLSKNNARSCSQLMPLCDLIPSVGMTTNSVAQDTELFG